MSRFDRRTFLKAAAASALAGQAILRAKPAAAARKKRKFTMALVCGSIGVKADQRESIRLAAAHGFESVAPSPQYLATLSAGQLEELLADLKSKNVVWAAAGLPVNFRSDQATFDSGIKKLPELADALQRAGATRVGTWITPTHDTLPYADNLRQHGARLGEAARILADRGLRLGLEYVGPKTSWTKAKYPFVHNMVQAQELVAATGQDNVGLVLDSWHWYTAGETADDILKLSNDDVVACDLNDAPAGIPVDEQMDLSRELPMATGVIDLKAFLDALVAIGYDGPIRAEPFNQELRAMPDEEAVAATAAAMKKAFALVE
jgi:sugar phosphate isomerase/epimerase